MSARIELDSSTVERIAARVAQLLGDEAMTGELVDAAKIARRFGVSRAWVYEHADELGAVRLGDGERPRLRFNPKLVVDRLGSPKPPASPKPQARHPRRSTADLLPIRGRTP